MKLLLKKINTWTHDRKQMWLPDAHLCYFILSAARPCVAVLLHGAATSSAISPQMHQQNPADAPPESRGTTRIRRTPTESCLHLQRAGLDNSIELLMVQIHPGVSEIWVPQSLAQVLPDLTSFWPMGKPMWGKWANNYDSAQLQVQTSPWNFKWGQSIHWFQRYAFRKVWTQFVPNLTSFWAMGKPIWGKWANDHDGAQLQA